MTPWMRILRCEQAILEKRFADVIPELRAVIEAGGLDAHAPCVERGEYVPLPEAALAEMLCGVALCETGAVDEGLRHLDRAVSLDREEPRVHANRGHFRRESGQLLGAISDLTRALELRADYGFARFRRAQAFLDVGDVVAAERDLDMILVTNPSDTVASELRAECRRRRTESGP